jgi:DNA-binding CsgD family transcriptional regulator
MVCSSAVALPVELDWRGIVVAARRAAYPAQLGFAPRNPRILGLRAAASGPIFKDMATARARSRCRERIGLLADSESDLDLLRREAIVELRRTIGFDRWCAMLVDPDTLALNRGIGENDLHAELPRLNLHDAGQGDLNTATILARGRDHVGVLSGATGGDLARSWRWREILAPYGVGDELRTVVTDERGSWGDFHLFRDSDDPPFDADEAQLIRDVSSLLARALRRGVVAPTQNPEPAPAEAGVLVLGNDLRPRHWTESARAWFIALNPAQTLFPDGIPNPVWSVAGRLLAAEQGDDPSRPPRVRVRTAAGTWAVLEAARLQGGDGGIAVSMHPAGMEDVLDLLCRAHGLTDRERELVALLVEGFDTREIAERLFISRHTVQDHLKSVFEKVGVHSRLELVSGVFAQAA